MLDIGSTANSHLFNNSKNQWNSESILEWISKKTLSNHDAKILAICDFDAYSNGLNFVFGEAQMGGKSGSNISIKTETRVLRSYIRPRFVSAKDN
jgi:predicted Zn-dependent protease